MKKTFLFSITMIMLILMGNFAFSQINPNNPQYQTMKAQGLIPQPQQVNPIPPIPAILPSNKGTNFTAGLKVPLDGTFTLAMTPNDDGSTGVLSLPFTFCFYGTNQNAFYINNNGNVSFGGSYSEYTATGFPYAGFPMLAPFWADVDTRGVGNVYYKIEPHRVVVIWNETGYFSVQTDKRNTFELIFTDGTDPLIGVGNNVAFSYSTMQWTTGSASGGVNGFGGSPATAGINRGDGVKYALVGRFDHAGNDFNGVGGISGVGYLTGKYYQFNACNDNPIIPATVPISNWALILMGVVLLAVGTVYIVRR